MKETTKRILRTFLPRTPTAHRIKGGQLAGAQIVTSWRDYPAAIMGYAEKELTAWLLGQVRPGETWLDVGAHYGYTSLAMCRATGIGGRVFAFEPSLSSAGCIARTRLANRHWMWTVCPFGLDDSTVVAVHELPWIRGMIDSQVPLAQADGTERFLSVGLDAVWASLSGGDERIHGIKMDVQGMEVRALAGMRQALGRHRPALVLEIHAGVDRAEVIEILAAAGYAPTPEPIEKGSTDFFDPQSNFSFVFRAKWISALILTRNEEQDLPGCLDGLVWCDDVHVFDSCSTDRTAEVARSRGARVTARAFDGYASQRNAALHGLPFKHRWVLSVDADERLPVAARDECLRFAGAAPEAVVAARLRRRDFLFGRWLEHAQISPYYIRLVRPDRVRYEREINEVLLADGAIADLREPFDHFPFSKGLSHWVDKHNRYSTMEAARALAERDKCAEFSWRRALFDRDFNVRRFHQKGLYYRMPARPLLKWVYMVVGRRAFLDGHAGVTYATLQAFYEFLIVQKEHELRVQQSAQ
jgi:FkbM family methyltransferase